MGDSGPVAMTLHRSRPSALGLSAAIAIALAALTLSACKRTIKCTAEVTAGAGSFKATTTGEDTDKPSLRREAVRDACKTMCEGGKDTSQGCAARCLVDAEAGKVGAKIDCVDVL